MADARRARPANARRCIAVVAIWLCFWPVAADADDWQVSFTPGSDCTGLVVTAIHSAKTSVLVQAYSFTSAPIAQALADAHRRGVDVRIILDKSQIGERYTSAKFFVNSGIPVWIDDKVAIAHNKVMIIDDETAITGSFNLTRSAQERNAENLLIIQNADLAAKYVHNWKVRQGVSRVYRPG